MPYSKLSKRTKPEGCYLQETNCVIQKPKRRFKFIKYPHINLCHFHFTNAVSVINEFCSKRFFKLLNKNARNVLGFNILHKMLIYIIGLIIKVQRVLFCTRTTSIGFFLYFKIILISLSLYICCKNIYILYIINVIGFDEYVRIYRYLNGSTNYKK